MKLKRQIQRKGKPKHHFWVRSISQRRSVPGAFKTLFQELTEDWEQFFRYLECHQNYPTTYNSSWRKHTKANCTIPYTDITLKTFSINITYHYVFWYLVDSSFLGVFFSHWQRNLFPCLFFCKYMETLWHIQSEFRTSWNEINIVVIEKVRSFKIKKQAP